jgi:acyl-CoA thioester hydrolase
MNAPTRDAYSYWQVVSTRWRDNDIYGHVNNAVYYSYIDSVINGYMVKEEVLDPWNSEIVGIVVESHCEFYRPLRYPVLIDGGMRVEQLGTSSVRYEVGMFPQDESRAAAVGGFTHVFVHRSSNRPVPIPRNVRAVLEKLQNPI